MINGVLVFYESLLEIILLYKHLCKYVDELMEKPYDMFINCFHAPLASLK